MFGLGVPELIILIMIFGIPILIYVLVKKNKANQGAKNDEQYKGVAGWLLLFCLGLTVFTPLITLGSLAAGYSESSKYFDQFPGLLVITLVDTLLSLCIIALSVYAGIGLWRIRPGAVQMAKRYLLCFLGYHVVAALLPFMAGLPSAANEAMIGQVAKDTFRGIIYVVIWYLYLNNSKRVSATYALQCSQYSDQDTGLENVIDSQCYHCGCAVTAQDIPCPSCGKNILGK